MIVNKSLFAIENSQSSRLNGLDFKNLPFGRIFSDHMIVCDYANGAWMQPKIMPYGKMLFAPSMMAFHYGQLLFEGMKAYRNSDGKVLVFRPEENWKRLNRSAQRMAMPEVPKEVFLQGLQIWLDMDREWIPNIDGPSFYIRPFMMATDEYVGVAVSESYRFLIIGSPSGHYYGEPVKVKVERHYTRAATGGTGFAKCAGNYGAALYPARLAQQQGYRQLIWTDAKEHRFIEESGTMNIMFVINGVLTTPPAGDTILEGITRKSMLQIAQEIFSIPVEERPIEVDEIVAGIKSGAVTEAFGCGTAAVVAPIALIHCDGEDLVLPTYNPQSINQKMFAYIDQLKRGKIEDVFGWNMVI
jgi:branched-chain amino acid aminotransferase